MAVAAVVRTVRDRHIWREASTYKNAHLLGEALRAGSAIARIYRNEAPDRQIESARFLRKSVASRKGSTNRRTAAIYRLVKEHYPDYDPVLQMIAFAVDEGNDLALRAQCAKEVAQYLYPKRKAVEVSGEDGGPVKHSVKVHFVSSNG